MNIKELIKGTEVVFTHYQHGEMWYEVTGMNFNFPVPITDIGDEKLLAKDKTITLMRWIRKHLEMVGK